MCHNKTMDTLNKTQAEWLKANGITHQGGTYTRGDFNVFPNRGKWTMEQVDYSENGDGGGFCGDYPTLRAALADLRTR